MRRSLFLGLFGALFAPAFAGVPKSFGIINVDGVGDVHVMAEDWMNIQVYDNGYTAHGYYGIQFATRDPNGAYSKDIYQKFYLKDKHFDYDIDLSQVGCHCNAAAHFNKMPAPNPGPAGTYYCDGNHINDQWCPEYDVFEGNKHTVALTLHKCNGGNGYYDSCDRGGCQTNAFYVNPGLMCPEDRCIINTNRPFHVSNYQTANQVNIYFNQEGKEANFNVCNDQGYENQFNMNYDDVVYCSSMWGGNGNDMKWLDGMTGCQGDCNIDASTVRFSNFRVW